jgi:hypothetical protein
MRDGVEDDRNGVKQLLSFVGIRGNAMHVSGRTDVHEYQSNGSKVVAYSLLHV